MLQKAFRPGDWVIYRKTKHSVHPGPRASNVAPARHGDFYSYTVDKFWIVESIQADGTLVLKTRRGKRHELPVDDPCLRRANLLQRLLYRGRFLAIASDASEAIEPEDSSVG